MVLEHKRTLIKNYGVEIIKKRIGCNRNGKLPIADNNLCMYCLYKFDDVKCKKFIRDKNLFVIYEEV